MLAARDIACAELDRRIHTQPFLFPEKQQCVTSKHFKRRGQKKGTKISTLKIVFLLFLSIVQNRAYSKLFHFTCSIIQVFRMDHWHLEERLHRSLNPQPIFNHRTMKRRKSRSIQSFSQCPQSPQRWKQSIVNACDPFVDVNCKVRRWTFVLPFQLHFDRGFTQMIPKLYYFHLQSTSRVLRGKSWFSANDIVLC